MDWQSAPTPNFRESPPSWNRPGTGPPFDTTPHAPAPETGDE